MEASYLIEGTCLEDDRPEPEWPIMTTTRPTGEGLSLAYGRGVYTTYRPDGQAVRTYHVRLNRKGTLSVESNKADGLEGMSTLNLERLVKRFDAVTKIWPTGVAQQVRKVNAEIQRRKDMVDSVAAKQRTVLEAEEVAS